MTCKTCDYGACKGLHKWPLLFVKGEDISPEQAGEIIVRTTQIETLNQWEADDRSRFQKLFRRNVPWEQKVFKAYGLKADRRFFGASFESLEEVRERLGVIPLEYLHNGRIIAQYATPHYGWCHWHGAIEARGHTLSSKWPDPEEITQEWQDIAEAFPFLDLTAQLTTNVDYAEDHDVEAFQPLMEWRIKDGKVTRLDTPGPLVVEPATMSTNDLISYFFFKPNAEQGVEMRYLKDAIARCERRGA